MDTILRFHMELMSRGRVHVHVIDESGGIQEELHYNRPDHKKNRYLQKLCQKAREGQLTSEEAEKLGEVLFHLLFNEGARVKFLEIYNKPRRQLPLLHIELTIDEKILPALARLPWEFLRLPLSEQMSAIWLSSNPHLCFLRQPLQHGEPLSLRLEPDKILKIAVVVANALPDAPVLYMPVVERLYEWADRLPRRVSKPKIVLEGTRKNIMKELRSFQPHLVHFIGHTQFTEHGKGNVALVNEIPIGSPEWIPAEQFAALFEPVRPGLKVVVLQACESAAGSQISAFASVAAHVLSHRVPAVVAMQYEISNMAAVCFARTFYDILLRGRSIDQAVQEARFALDQEAISSNLQGYYGYFATPVLFRYAYDRQLWEENQNTSSEAEASDLHYYSVIQSCAMLKEAACVFGQESVIAHDRCIQCQEELVQLQKALTHLYEMLDHPANDTKRLEYATLFNFAKMGKRVQELYEVIGTFCSQCPPPFLLLGPAYQQQREGIGRTLQAIETDLTALMKVVKPSIVRE